MPKRLPAALFALTALLPTLAPVYAVSGEIPVTPQMREQVSQYAMQVTKKSCGEIRALRKDSKGLPFKAVFESIFSLYKAQASKMYPNSTFTSNINERDKSGYFTIKSGNSHALNILSEKIVNGQPSYFLYSCMLSK